MFQALQKRQHRNLWGYGEVAIICTGPDNLVIYNLLADQFFTINIILKLE